MPFLEGHILASSELIADAASWGAGYALEKMINQW